MDSQLLPSFEPSEKEMVEYALSQPLEKKIERAISLLRHYERKAKELSAEGFYLAFSGGKDSIVIKQLAKEAGVLFGSHYNLTTIDPPELVRFIKNEHKDVVFERQEKSMMQTLVDSPMGMPTRKARWCCALYKENGGVGLIKIIGVRISESPRRAKLWNEFRQDRHNTGGAYLAPIVYWTDEDVWSFIKARNIPYCSLYDDGFKRLGCIGCPLAGDKDRVFQFERWPKYEAMWRRASVKWWNKWSITKKKNGEDRAFVSHIKDADDLWRWWMHQRKEDECCEFEQMMMNV